MSISDQAIAAAAVRGTAEPRPTREIRFAVGESSVGSVLVARGGRQICAILLGDDRGVLVHELRGRRRRSRARKAPGSRG